MKNIILTIYTLLLPIISFTQKPLNYDLKELNLNDKIKYIEECTYADIDYDDKIGQREIASYEFTRFNERGNIDFAIYRSQSLFMRYKYTSMDNITESLQFDIKGKLESKEVYKYDNKGNKIEYLYYDAGVLLGKALFIYDNKNNNIENIGYNSNGERGTSYKTKYNSRNQKLQTIYYKPQGEIINTTNYNFYPQTNEYQSVSLDLKGDTLSISKYKLDMQGNKTSENIYTMTDASRENSVWEYVYDKKNNWIKQMEYKNDKLITIIERKIIYYGDKDANNYPQWDKPSFKGKKI